MKHVFSFICCGSVDDGKSTLIGRMLLDSGNVKLDQLQDAEKISKRNGSDRIELSLLLDGLLSEREQQITIDVAHRYFDYNDIRFHILDCPGHEQYTKNMAVAAAMTNTAVLVIDCQHGIQKQTLRHIEICSLLRVKNLCICLTKCDLLHDTNIPENSVIQNLTKEIQMLMQKYHFNYTIIPISAVTGYNVDKVFNQICVYAQEVETEQKCILHVQAARLSKETRFYYAKETTEIPPKIGQTYMVYPVNTVVTVTNMLGHGVFNIDKDVDIEQGDCITDASVYINNILNHQTIWFDGPTEEMLLKHGTRVVRIKTYSENQIETDAPIIFNDIDDIKQNGFAIIIDNKSKRTIGCCVFINNKNVQNVAEQLDNKIEKLKTILRLQGLSDSEINKMIASIQ